LNKEPTLPQACTKLESVFTADNRVVFEWVAGREEPHDFLGRREALNRPAAAPPLHGGEPRRLSPHGCLSGILPTRT